MYLHILKAKQFHLNSPLFYIFLIVFFNSCIRYENGVEIPQQTGKAQIESDNNKNAEVKLYGTPGDLQKIQSIYIDDIGYHNNFNLDEFTRKEIYKKLVDAFTQQVNLRVYSKEIVTGQSKQPVIVSFSNGNNLKAKSDGILKLTLNDYKERVGSQFGSTSPAKISFQINLLRQTDNKLIWSANYFFLDKAVTDNLFEIKERFTDSKPNGWQKASELLIQGFNESAQKLESVIKKK